MYDLPDHPDIAETMRTGYPNPHEDEGYPECEVCGKIIDPECDDVYEDEEYECLCGNCLLKLHDKHIWLGWS